MRPVTPPLIRRGTLDLPAARESGRFRSLDEPACDGLVDVIAMLGSKGSHCSLMVVKHEVEFFSWRFESGVVRLVLVHGVVSQRGRSSHTLDDLAAHLACGGGKLASSVTR